MNRDAGQDEDLIDVPDGVDIGSTPCAVEWCRAKRRVRVGVMKYSDGRLVYPDCGDRAGDYAGLAHRGRVLAAATHPEQP